MNEICRITKRSKVSIYLYLNFYGVPFRGRLGRLSKAFLEKTYVEQQLSLQKISDKTGRSIEAIRHDLIHYKIPRRKWHGGGVGRGPYPPRLAKDKLIKMYVEDRMSIPEIAEEIGRGKHGIFCAFKAYGIPRRTISEAKQIAFLNGRTPDINGKNNQMWKGGISFEPYPPVFNEKLKRKIRNRDGHVCQYCGKTQEREKDELKKKLAVHHIDGNKDNCLSSNLITACAACNSKLIYVI